MKNYILIKNNVVENVILADQNFVDTLTGYDHIVEAPESQHVAPGWTYNAETDEFIALPIELVPIAESKLSVLQFQLRFTFDELVAIEIAAETNPAVRVLQRQQQVAEYIDIADPNTQLGIMYLVSVGLLTHARGLEILA